MSLADQDRLQAFLQAGDDQPAGAPAPNASPLSRQPRDDQPRRKSEAEKTAPSLVSKNDFLFLYL